MSATDRLRPASEVHVSLPGQPLRLGETYGQAAGADLAEVIVIKGTPPMGEVEAWERALMDKYGVKP